MFSKPLVKTLLPLLCSAAVLISSGCALDPAATPAASTGPQSLSGHAINGLVHGGYFAVTGATVQLWYPGVTAYGSASNLLATATVTGSNFSFSSAYTCPAADMPVYITATGGNPGLASGTNNTYLAVAAYIGQCGSVASETVVVNELTTVALAFSVGQFSSASQAANGTGSGASGTVGGLTIGSVSGTTATNGGNIGAPIGTLSGGLLTVTNSLAYTNLKNAFATSLNLVDPISGNVGPLPSITNISNDAIGPYTTTNKINAMGNVLASCVQTNGSSPAICSGLAAIGTNGVTPTSKTLPTDTFQMALYMALSPATNVTNVFNYGNPNQTVFGPVPASAPFDWTLAITYNNLNNTAGGVGYGLLQPAIDAKGQVWVASTSTLGIFGLSPTGQPLNSGNAYPGNGTATYSGATGTTVDASGNIWTANGGSASSSLVELIPTATPSYVQYKGATSPSCGPSGLALDNGYNFLYTCVKETSSPAYPLNGLMNGGTVSAPSYSATSTVGNTATGATGQVSQIATDTAGNIWVPISSTKAAVVEMIPSPLPATSTPTSYAAQTAEQGGTAGTGGGVIVDHAGNVWFDAAQTTFSKLVPGTSTVTNYSGTTGGQLNSAYLAVDGAGDIWMANASGSVIGTGANAVKYFTISEFNNSGNAVTPANSSGVTPGGYPHNFGQVKSVAVDGSGNVWVPNYQAPAVATSYQITSSTTVQINGSSTGIPASLFPANAYVTLYGFPTSTFLNGLTILIGSSANSAGSVTGTIVGSTTLTAGSTVTETGYANIGSGAGPIIAEIVGAAVPVYAPLGAAAAANKQGVLP